MNKAVYAVAGVCAAMLASGCVVRTYEMTRDRIDQDLSAGNRGFVAGQAPAVSEDARKTTRTTQVVEVELGSPLRFDKKKQCPEPVAQTPAQEESWGNRGYVTESVTPQIAEPEASVAGEKCTVQKGDTLQKISQKYFGTTKKWYKIYKLNEETLKGPNKLYPGQVITIPTEGLKEPAQNLK